MIKNSVKRKDRDWDWQRINVPQLALASDSSVAWRCRKYLAWINRFPDGTVLLSIGDPARRHNWQDIMRIKREMLGEHWAGVEVYPSDDLVVDHADAYHLWCTPRQLRIGWDDGGEYTVEHAFYTSHKTAGSYLSQITLGAVQRDLLRQVEAEDGGTGQEETQAMGLPVDDDLSARLFDLFAEQKAWAVVQACLGMVAVVTVSGMEHASASPDAARMHADFEMLFENLIGVLNAYVAEKGKA